MLSQPLIRDWARRLIASEIEGRLPLAQTELVYEKLRRQLCAPVGIDGFQALASRALSLAKSQSPRLKEVQVSANGGLSGFSKIDFELGTDIDEDGEVGILLIEQLLGLLLTLLGEAATVRLVADVPFRLEVESKTDTTETMGSAPSTNYLGPFEDILLEAERLRCVSDRLETLADKHVGIEEVMTVAGSIRSIAAVLDVFTMIRSKVSSSQDNALSSSPNSYLN